MDYAAIGEARKKPGLRLVMNKGVPGPWSQSAKYVFEVKSIPYIPVAQLAGTPNDELHDWTGHRNAPIAIFDDELPRVGWHEIIMLAVRLNPEPSLLPGDAAARAEVFGLITEIASENGFAWQRRLQLIEGLNASLDERAQSGGATLASRYGYSNAALSQAEGRAAEILKMLSAKLHAQQDAGSNYFVGCGFTAVDLYWACFSQLVAPLDESVNRMPGLIRNLYSVEGTTIAAAVNPILIAHRDRVYEKHLSLPLEF